MRAWYEVIKPREDILSGELNEAIFAANLADVLHERAPLEYRDPAHFFQQTYPTQGLVNLLATVAKRLAEGVGDSVIQLQTPFGGGKTHALISLYHLFRHGMQYRGAALVRQSLERAGLDALPEVRIACFVGEDADPLKGKTPWGALAEQLGVYPLVEEHDRRHRAPGRELVLKMLGEQPTLILLDELVPYLVGAKDFQDQVAVFCQQLTEAVGVAPRAALVATLPSSAPYGDEGERALHQLEQIFGRVQALYTPVEGDEFFRVLRQRLMQEVIDPTELNRTVDAFFELYRHSDVPEEARQHAYRERMRLAYPFHPLVIDTLDRRWSTYSTFQRTRGVLKFLASVLRDMYERQVNTPLILPAHLNLEYAPIRQELLRHIGNQYAGVISQDIAGAGANAVQIDQQLGAQLGAEYAPMRIASGLATAIFFGSFSAGEQVGVTEPELRLASLRPNLPPAVIGDALHKLTQKLWYLHSEGGLYAFRLTPNLNKILLEKEEQVRAQELAERIRKEVEARLGRETMQPLAFPNNPSDIPDTKELKLVVLAPEHLFGKPETQAFVQELLTRAGDKPRVYRATCFVLAPDANELEQLQRRVKQLLALEAIQRDSTLMQRLSEEDKHTVEKRISDIRSALPQLVLSAYRHLAMWRENEVKWFNLGIPTAGKQEPLSSRVVSHLRKEDLLVDRVSPQLVRDKVVGADTSKPLAEVVDAFYKYPSLPMVETPQVVVDAVQRGVQEGLFAVQIGERVYFKEPVSLSEGEYGATVRTDYTLPATEPSEPTAPTHGDATPTPARVIENGVELLPSPAASTSASTPAPRYRRYALRARFSTDKFSEVFSSVIKPLLDESGRSFTFTIEFEVDGELPKQVVDMRVSESARQLGQVEREEKA
jgi:hypothetical protein